MTMKFAGTLLDKPFGPTEAESPNELYECLKSPDDPVAGVRCFILMNKSEDSVWLEVVLHTFLNSSRPLSDSFRTTYYRFNSAPLRQTAPRTILHRKRTTSTPPPK
jgi:hypothetical protein